MAIKKEAKTEKAVKPVRKAAVSKTVKPKAEKKVKEKVVKSNPKEVTAEVVETEKKHSHAHAKAEKYFYAVGRRKTSVAQVRIYEDEKAGDSDLVINDKKMKDYFPIISLQNNLLAPLKAVGMSGKFRFTILVRGGGVTGQVEAARLGIARALVKYNEEYKKALKDLQLLTRDSREVERKKAGLKKARRAPQWAKR